MRFFAVALVLLVISLQYRLWFSPGGLSDVRQLQGRKQALLQENKRLEERNTSLVAEVIELKQGEEAIAERARSEMGMIRSDEVFYQIVDSQATRDNPEPLHDLSGHAPTPP